MPVNPDIIFILLYFQEKVYRQSEPRKAAAYSTGVRASGGVSVRCSSGLQNRLSR